MVQVRLILKNTDNFILPLFRPYNGKNIPEVLYQLRIFHLQNPLLLDSYHRQQTKVVSDRKAWVGVDDLRVQFAQEDLIFACS